MSITGFRHVGITVTDLERSAAWYARVLGFEELFREADGPRTAVVMGRPGTPLLLGLVHFADGVNDAFSPFRTGLDHLCLAVTDREEVEAWARRLDERGVANAGVEEMRTSPVVHFKDPDGIARCRPGLRPDRDMLACTTLRAESDPPGEAIGRATDAGRGPA